MRANLLPDLKAIGYAIFLNGDQVKLKYQKPGDPPVSARYLIEELKNCKTDAVKFLKSMNTLTSAEKTQLRDKREVIWRNPYPQGTPEARRASLQEVIRAMLYGLPPTDDEQSRHIKNIVQDILAGKAKLEDLRHLLGQLH